MNINKDIHNRITRGHKYDVILVERENNDLQDNPIMPKKAGRPRKRRYQTRTAQTREPSPPRQISRSFESGIVILRIRFFEIIK